mmetsp:Transcript_43034/g.111379  ORF Transcript_43034/g.111379 Transcript_43034/m.111379 type:complete len:99 (+) Transcript_43034:1211-1507(+)
MCPFTNLPPPFLHQLCFSPSHDQLHQREGKGNVSSSSFFWEKEKDSHGIDSTYPVANHSLWDDCEKWCMMYICPQSLYKSKNISQIEEKRNKKEKEDR